MDPLGADRTLGNVTPVFSLSNLQQGGLGLRYEWGGSINASPDLCITLKLVLAKN